MFEKGSLIPLVGVFYLLPRLELLLLHKADVNVRGARLRDRDGPLGPKEDDPKDAG